MIFLAVFKSFTNHLRTWPSHDLTISAHSYIKKTFLSLTSSLSAASTNSREQWRKGENAIQFIVFVCFNVFSCFRVFFVLNKKENITTFEHFDLWHLFGSALCIVNIDIWNIWTFGIFNFRILHLKLWTFWIVNILNCIHFELWNLEFWNSVFELVNIDIYSGLPSASSTVHQSLASKEFPWWTCWTWLIDIDIDIALGYSGNVMIDIVNWYCSLLILLSGTVPVEMGSLTMAKTVTVVQRCHGVFLFFMWT